MLVYQCTKLKSLLIIFIFGLNRFLIIVSYFIFIELGFVFRLVPMAVISGLFFVASLDCTNFAIPYVSVFYLSVANRYVEELARKVTCTS